MGKTHCKSKNRTGLSDFVHKMVNYFHISHIVYKIDFVYSDFFKNVRIWSPATEHKQLRLKDHLTSLCQLGLRWQLSLSPERHQGL